MDASNPVYYRGKVYVGCVVAPGYQHRSRAKVGDIDIWEIDPQTRNTTLIDTTGIQGGMPRLAASTDGRFVLIAHEMKNENTTIVRSAWGWYGGYWEAQGDLGGILHNLVGDVPDFYTGVTALQLSKNDHVATIIYTEHQKVSQDRVPPAPDPTNPGPLPDPNNPQNTVPRLTDYRKMVVTFDACSFPIAASLMELGTSVDPENADAYAETPNMFEDENDGLAYYVEDNGGELFYFAVNDYGAMQYGAVVVNPPPTLCYAQPPLIGVQAAAIPQALTVSSTASLALGSTAAVAAVAITAYLLAVKRKTPQFTAAEDK
jgi:hypothetical protein